MKYGVKVQLLVNDPEDAQGVRNLATPEFQLEAPSVQALHEEILEYLTIWSQAKPVEPKAADVSVSASG